MSTRIQIEAAAMRRLGGASGSISSGDANSAVLTDMIDTTGDDAFWRGGTLLMPDAANTTDMARNIEEWDDSAGKAAWVVDRADTTYTSETFIIIPSYLRVTKRQMDTALDDVLQRTRRHVQTVLPTLDDHHLYSLGRFSWIRSDDDVDLVEQRFSPNMLDNSNFSVWGSGPAAAPTSWTLAGSGGAIARTTTGAVVSNYAAAITRAGSNVTLTQSLGHLNNQFQGETVTLGAYLRSGAASSLRIGISDGSTTTYSSYHAGDDVPTWTTVSATLASTSTTIDAIISLETDETAEVSNIVLEHASSIDNNLKTRGDQIWRRRPLNGRVISIGAEQFVELEQMPGIGSQLLMTSRQPFPTLSADSTACDCPDTVIVPGLMHELAMRYTQDGNDAYWARVSRAGAEYAAAMRHLLQIPAAPASRRVVVGSA